MNNTEVIKKARNIFPNGINNYYEEKRLMDLLNFYKVPFTKESLHKILSVDLNEKVYETVEESQVKQEA